MTKAQVIQAVLNKTRERNILTNDTDLTRIKEEIGGLYEWCKKN
jgi:hypothetical protein